MIITVDRSFGRGCPEWYYLDSNEILGFGTRHEQVSPIGPIPEDMDYPVRISVRKINLVFKNGQEWIVRYTEELEDLLVQVLENRGEENG